MAGARVELSIDLGEAQNALQRAVQSLGDDGQALLLADIGEHLLRSTRDRAALQVDPDGHRWRALEPSYARWKKKKRPGVPILKFDNHMLGDQLSAQLEGHDTLLVGTNAVYGAIHQFGGQTPRGNIPSRPWLGISTDDEAEIVQLTLDHLQAALDGGALNAPL